MDLTSDPSFTLDDPAAWAEGLLRRQALVLDALAETALRMARTLEQEAAGALAEGRPVDPQTPARFARVVRAVRLTALAQSRLLQAFDEARARHARQADQAHEAAVAEAAQSAARADPAYGHKARVEAIVTRVARAEHEDDDDRVERLVAEAAERLDDDDVYGEVSRRPIGELVSLICRDLDLKPDWTRLADEAWALAERAEGDPRSPFKIADLPRPPPLAGEGDPKGGGGVPHLCPTPPQSASLTAPPPAGEHAKGLFP